jgi:nonsense-mediated mRNA decay protein 3
MSPHELVCIQCAGPLSANQEGVVCATCLRKEVEEKEELLILPDSVSFTICKLCLARQVGRHWERPQPLEKTIEDTVLATVVPAHGVTVHEITVASRMYTEKQYPCVLTATLELDGEVAKRNYHILAFLGYHVCEVCSRKAGNYFAAIFQIRRDREIPEERLDELLKTVADFVATEAKRDWQAFYSKVEHIHGGLDFYLSTSSLAQKVAHHVQAREGGELKTSTSLTGRKDGRNIYRNTYSVRLPDLEAGNVVKWHSPYHNKDRFFVLGTPTRRGVHVVDLETHLEEFLDKRHFEELVRSERGEQDLEAIVLFSLGGELKIMDPETYETVTLLKPRENMEFVDGEPVPILKTDFGIFLAP